jgi:hypothetical protein
VKWQDCCSVFLGAASQSLNNVKAPPLICFASLRLMSVRLFSESCVFVFFFMMDGFDKIINTYCMLPKPGHSAPVQKQGLLCSAAALAADYDKGISRSRAQGSLHRMAAACESKQ